jgi:hypothetical protein
MVNKSIQNGLLILITIVLFFGGGFVLYMAIRKIVVTQNILKTQNVQNATIVTVLKTLNSIGTSIYLKVENDNEPHRTRAFTKLSKNDPQPMQAVYVRSDEDRKIWVIDGYVKEAYILYILEIIASVVVLNFAVLFLILTIKFI